MEQELTQGGAGQEVTSEATPTDEKATSRERTEDEFKKMQSMKDKAAAEADSYRQHLQSVQGEMQQLQYQVEQQKLGAQQKELEALADDPDAQSRLRKLYQREESARRYEEYLQDRDRGLTAKRDRARNLAKEYKFDDPNDELLTAETPREMELMAQLKGKEPVVTHPPVKETFAPDSGTSDTGGDSDEAFVKGWNSGDIPATKENLARSEKILQKLK